MLHAEDPNQKPPYPPKPWKVCPRCGGNLRIITDWDRDEDPPMALYEINCMQCTHPLADWNRTLLTWRIREFRPPTVPAASSASDGKYLRDWRDLYIGPRKDAA